MKFSRLLILIAAAGGGAMVYKAQHAQPVISGGSERSAYDSLTGTGSLLETFKSARDTNGQAPGAANWQSSHSGLGSVGNPYGQDKAHFEQSAPAGATMPSDDAALLEAAADGNQAKVAARIAAKVKIDSRDTLRRTPLMLACWNGNREIISRLLAAGANTHLQDRSSHNAFDYAAARGQVETVRFLLERTHDDDDYYAEFATIMRAAYAGDPAQLPPGTGPLPSINRLTPQGQAPLHVVAGSGSVAMLEALTARGARIDLPGDGGQTPLHWAAWNNKPQSIDWLLAHGASPARADAAGNTPLMLAAQNNSREAAAALLHGGASKNAFNKEGRSAAMIAADKGHADLVKLLQ